MDEHQYQRIREVFQQVCDLSAEEQAHTLEALCLDDTELRDAVERLLTAIDDADDSDLDPEQFEYAERAPVIDGYTILRLLGEGGMGSVYEAEQLQPTRRVAIKVLRLGHATKALKRRFQLEAEALARLKHPGIAQVYEVGIDQKFGQPYIAMELVEGPTLSEYSRKNNLGVRAILELTIKLCGAVDHAHERGVIHRDLKPGNILIDDSGNPKILDFGIARVTEQDVRAVTLNTEVGQIIGTLAYMSPEQASGDPTQIDFRSDVYSLGVLLFEMLTGQLPYDTGKMQLAEALMVVRDHEPTRVSSLDTSFRGDIDTIITKALERDPDRRYQSAFELRNDLQRHLDDEPILARPQSVSYQLEKFAKRNKGFVASVCIVIFLLTAGVVSLSIALQRESEARRSAEESLERYAAAYEFVDEIFLGLDPKQTENKDTELLSMMLHRAEDRARTGIEIPIVRAEILTLIGQTYSAVFEYERAIAVLKEAIEIIESTSPIDNEQVHQAQSVLAASFHKLGQYERSEHYFQQMLEHERVHGDVEQLSITLRQYSEMIMDTGRFEEALGLIEEAFVTFDQHSALETGRQHQQLAAVLRRLGRYDEASESYLVALEQFSNVGADIESSITLNSLAIMARRNGNLINSERYYAESIALRESADRRVNPDTAATYSNLGRLYNEMGRYEDAVRVLGVSINLHLELFSTDHPNLTYPRLALAEAYRRSGSFQNALEQIQLAHALATTSFSDGHPLTILVETEFGHIHRQQQDYEMANRKYEVALELVETHAQGNLAYALPIWDGYTQSALEFGDPQFRMEILQRALRVYPEDDEERVRLENELSLLQQVNE
ncbi:MAG: protein kinase [Phycisphaerales bacterium]|nr:protein kinase [Phycisphaerales bacterium]